MLNSRSGDLRLMQLKDAGHGVQPGLVDSELATVELRDTDLETMVVGGSYWAGKLGELIRELFSC
jgi:hypothetical protein